MSPTAAELLIGRPLPPALDTAGWFTAGRPDLLWLPLALLMWAAYVTGMQRLTARGDRWPMPRTLSWTAGWLLVDLREERERQRNGVIPGALHVPYPRIGECLAPSGWLRELLQAGGSRRLVFYCAYGERSAMAVNAAREAGIINVAHLVGGIDAWVKSGGKVLPPPSS